MVLDGYLMTCMGLKEDLVSDRAKIMHETSFAWIFSESLSCDRIQFLAFLYMLSAYTTSNSFLC